MVNHFSRIFYGVVLENKDAYRISQIIKKEEESYDNVQFGIKVDMCYDFTESTVYFLYIYSTMQKVDTNGIHKIDDIQFSILWDTIFENFCNINDATYNIPGWYLTNEIWL